MPVWLHEHELVGMQYNEVDVMILNVQIKCSQYEKERAIGSSPTIQILCSFSKLYKTWKFNVR